MDKTCYQPMDDLTFHTIVEKRKAFHKHLLEDTSGIICLDLSAIKRCDTAGLAFLIEAKKLCKKHQKHFEIESMSDKMRTLAKFCGLEALL